MAGCDRISELPESLLTQILSYLPTKDSVKTSLLSKRWEFVWLRVPGLDLRFNDFPEEFPPSEQALESFVNKFLEFNKDSRMQTFKIQYEYEQCDDDQLVVWIDKAVDRGVQHLYVETEKAPNITQSIYRSNTLVSLTLLSVGLESPKSVVSLPCLKMMHIEDVWYDYDDPLIMEKIISGCPALEELSVIRPVDSYNADVVKFLRVRSQTLKRFCLMFENCWGGTDFSVEIDAPSLEYMSFRDDQSDVIVVKNLTSLYMIDIDSEFNVKFGGSPLEPEDSSKKDTIHEFFSGISGVRYMIISRPTLEVLYQYSKMGSIPKFINLYRLYAAFSCFTLQLLPIFLESCPNLKDLILDYTVVSAQPEEIELSYVPRCLTSSLERVYINKLIMKEETGVRLVNYFLDNSAVLKELTVSFTDSPVSNQERDIYKNLLTSNKISRRCQVSIC